MDAICRKSRNVSKEERTVFYKEHVGGTEVVGNTSKILDGKSNFFRVEDHVSNSKVG
jgi:hypothetical protein